MPTSAPGIGHEGQTLGVEVLPYKVAIFHMRRKPLGEKAFTPRPSLRPHDLHFSLHGYDLMHENLNSIVPGVQLATTNISIRPTSILPTGTKAFRRSRFIVIFDH
ncbi:hypothetical protein CERZMDRAFT_90810 [Cercospora zeae-maydis SCOH1-5]|uniref:Uncharacterized protein n=1 Tax=Cercospora zeae-maydis SCOH1-5 TaxID=717836 RepID=A0A6A6FEY8_9PEZI|nr:hypothetical protein CERZMDRAFT_90810 [Cercospora zeae-maydis SCOH1-5]